MSSPIQADRDPIDGDWLRAELVRPGSLWRRLDVVAEAGSTNTDLAARARAGEPPGAVLVTGYQSAGRGRQGRAWTAPPGANVAMSVLVAPHDVAGHRWTWLPLLAGVAVVEALRRVAGVPALLKWPNDVLVEGGKVSGILAERVDTPAGPACVVGMGINVHLRVEDLPVPSATSLALLRPGAEPSRNRVIAAVLGAFALLFTEWEMRDDDASFAAAYVARSDTIGREVRVRLADGQVVEGVAEAVDGDGRLVVRTPAGRQVLGAGDVIHLRA